MSTHYETLGVGRQATAEEIRSAYRGLAKRYHPDKRTGDEKRFKDITAAYEVLGDEKKKRAYDLSISLHEGGFGGRRAGHAPNDSVRQAVEDMFGANFNPFEDPFRTSRRGPVRPPRGGPVPSAAGGRPPGARTRPGRDVERTVFITLEEAVEGCMKPVTTGSGPEIGCGACNGSGAKPGTRAGPCGSCFGQGRKQRFSIGGPPDWEQCPACRGRGSIPLNPCGECGGNGVKRALEDIQVRIPAGIEDGQRLRVAQKGEPGDGRPPGDLYVTVKVQDHGTFMRKGMDLYLEKKIPLDVAVRGGKVAVPTLGGPPLDVDVPAGVDPGRTVITVRGGGIRSRMRDTRGDLYVTIQVDLPRVRTARADKLLQELMDETS